MWYSYDSIWFSGPDKQEILNSCRLESDEVTPESVRWRIAAWNGVLKQRLPNLFASFGWFGLVIALRPQTLKHIRGGWSHYTDTSEPVDGNGAQNTVIVQSGFELATFRTLAHEFTNCSNRARKHLLKRPWWVRVGWWELTSWLRK
jgi:hypothetical protein